MESAIFGPPGLYSALYSTCECPALYSTLQVYIHCIQHPNVELYIWPSRSILSTIFKILNVELYIRPLGLYSALYSTSEWALYSALQVYIQCHIQHPNVELYIRPWRSIIQHYIIHPNVELYIQPFRSTFSVRFKSPNVELYNRPSRSKFKTIFNIWMYSSLFGSTALYSARDSKPECRALYSPLHFYIERYSQHPNVELSIRPSRSIFTVFKIRIWSSIFGPPGLYWALYSKFWM